jgi:hypothetical protein
MRIERFYHLLQTGIYNNKNITIPLWEAKELLKEIALARSLLVMSSVPETPTIDELERRHPVVVDIMERFLTKNGVDGLCDYFCNCKLGPDFMSCSRTLCQGTGENPLYCFLGYMYDSKSGELCKTCSGKSSCRFRNKEPSEEGGLMFYEDLPLPCRVRKENLKVVFKE